MSPSPRECQGSQTESWGHIQHLPAGLGEPGQVGPEAAPTLQPLPLLSWHSSTTKVMRLAILADLHVEMSPEGNLELVTSACKPTLEEVQSTKEIERSTLRSPLLWHLGNRAKEPEAEAFLGRRVV